MAVAERAHFRESVPQRTGAPKVPVTADCQKNVVITSPEMVALFSELKEMVAPLDVAVLLTGESGTGKTRIAREIHNMSRRAARPFVQVNCAGISRELIEAELFGHKKGGFTGAISDRPGLIRSAAGGTLFLDEIAELPLDLQAKLLVFLDTNQVRPVGSDEIERVDVRVIAATNRDLEQRVREGTFREDLFYRLTVVSVEIPSLQDRPEDILPLAQYFLEVFNKKYQKQITRWAPDAFVKLMGYSWPGNVRQLEHVIEAAVVYSRDDIITVDAIRLPKSTVEPVIQIKDSSGNPVVDLLLSGEKITLDQLTKAHLLATLKRNGGNMRQTATEIGMNIRTLYNYVRRYEEQP